MSHPVVSVVMQTRRRAQLLRRAVASILAQTFHDFELIVVDDASTDAASEALQSFADPRLRLILRDNCSGAGAARNAGIAVSRGEFVAFQDEEDVWLAHKLETQLAALKAAPADAGLCLAAYLRWQQRDLGARYIGGPKFKPVLDFSQGLTGDVDYSLVATTAWLARRRLLERAGGFDERMKMQEGLDLAIRLSELGKVSHVDEPLHIQDHVLGSGPMPSNSLSAATLVLMLEKHGHRWNHDRALMARHYYFLGQLESDHGASAEALRWFGRALSSHWFYPKAWAGWLRARAGRPPRSASPAARDPRTPSAESSAVPVARDRRIQ